MRRGRRGVTLIEMLVVITILGAMTAIAYPSIGAGLDSLKLRAVCDEAAVMLGSAMRQAERSQQPVELRVLPHRIEWSGGGASRTLDLGPIRAKERVLFIEPHANPPAAPIEFASPAGRRRAVRMDPITGAVEVGDVEVPNAAP